MIQQTMPGAKRRLSGVDFSTTYPKNFALDYDEPEISLQAKGLRPKPWRA